MKSGRVVAKSYPSRDFADKVGQPQDLRRFWTDYFCPGDEEDCFGGCSS
jgi:hypothetical protein